VIPLACDFVLVVLCCAVLHDDESRMKEFLPQQNAINTLQCSWTLVSLRKSKSCYADETLYTSLACGPKSKSFRIERVNHFINSYISYFLKKTKVVSHLNFRVKFRHIIKIPAWTGFPNLCTKMHIFCGEDLCMWSRNSISKKQGLNIHIFYDVT